MLEVLVARTAFGLSLGSSWAYSARLASTFSKMASITTSESPTPSPFTSIRRRANAAAAADRVLQALVEESLGAVHRRLNQFRGAILQGDRHAAKRRPGGDVAAHDAGADDVHVAEFGGRFSAQALQPVLQQEYAHEIARCGSAHEIADGSCLSLIALGAGRAVALPQIENGVGRRILIASHAVPQRRGGLPGDERACRPQVQQLIHEGCRRLRRRTEQPCLGAIEQLGRRHEFIDQARGQCPRALVGFALEHQIERRTHADEPHRAHRAAESRMDAEQHLG